jgi:signal peptidase I
MSLRATSSRVAGNLTPGVAAPGAAEPGVAESATDDEQAGEAGAVLGAESVDLMGRPKMTAATYGKVPLMPTVADTVRSLVSMVVVALFLLTFVLQPFRIPSESMERTLLVGDFLLVNKQTYGPPGRWGQLLPYRSPERGDVVVFRFPLDANEYVVKRVIGIPGDRIHLSRGVVYRNGQALAEPYTVHEPAYLDPYRDNFPAGSYTDPGVDNHWWQTVRREAQTGDVTVPAGEYFVMGDNRNYSRDSRYWGFVRRGDILGRPIVIYFSLREPSATDVAPLPGDTLGHENGQGESLGYRILDFARWDRMFRIVR